MFNEKSTFTDLALFLTEHNLSCTRLTAPRASAGAVCVLAVDVYRAKEHNPAAYGTGPTIHEAINDAVRVLRASGWIS